MTALNILRKTSNPKLGKSHYFTNVEDLITYVTKALRFELSRTDKTPIREFNGDPQQPMVLEYASYTQEDIQGRVLVKLVNNRKNKGVGLDTINKRFIQSVIVCILMDINSLKTLPTTNIDNFEEGYDSFIDTSTEEHVEQEANRDKHVKLFEGIHLEILELLRDGCTESSIRRQLKINTAQYAIYREDLLNF